MNNEFNLEEFAKMFDAALASDNPAVKKALRNFMMVAAIVYAQEDDKRQMGPLETLVKKVDHLERIVRDLQNTRTYKDHKDKYYQDYYNNPTWVYSPNTSISTTSSTTEWKSTYNGKELETSELYDLLKDLKIT
jgi:hypothetical protein